MGGSESVWVECPECRRTHLYAPPAYPCACGAPVVPPLIAGVPGRPVTHRTWSDEWVAVRCTACGHEADWPHPEVGCACGTVLRVPVHPVAGAGVGAGPSGRDAAPEASYDLPSGVPYEAPYEVRSDVAYDAAPGAAYGPPGSAAAADASGGAPATGTAPARATDPASVPAPTPAPLPSTAPVPVAERAPFRPRTIRTARDAVDAVALFLRWLGFQDVLRTEERSADGIDLRGRGLVARVDPSTRPVGTRAVECLWLGGLSASSVGVLCSLAGYTSEARARADDIGVALFVLDLTGTPQPLNRQAVDLLG